MTPRKRITPLPNTEALGSTPKDLLKTADRGEPMDLDYQVELLVANGATLMCKLAVIDAPKSDKVVIQLAAARYNNEVANLNWIGSLVDSNYKDSVLCDGPADVYQRDSKVAIPGPGAPFLGTVFKEGKTDILAASQLVVATTRARMGIPDVRFGGFPSVVYKFSDMAYFNWEVAIKWEEGIAKHKWNSQNYVLFDAQIDGRSGRPQPGDAGEGIPRHHGVLRNAIREYIFTGELDDKRHNHVIEYGNTIDVYTPLNEVLSEDGKRGYFLVLSEVADEEYLPSPQELFLNDEDKKLKAPAGQFRFHASRMVILYVEDGTKFVDADPKQVTVNKSSNFKWLEASTVHFTRKVVGKEVPNFVKPPSEEVEVEEVVANEPEVAIVVEAPISNTPTVVEEVVAKKEAVKPTSVGTVIAKELESLYTYLQNNALYKDGIPVKMAPKPLTTEEVVDVFDGSNDERRAAYKSLYPGIVAKRLEVLATKGESSGQEIADAIRYYILSHLPEGTDVYNPELGNLPWTPAIVHGIGHIIVGLSDCLKTASGQLIRDFIRIQDYKGQTHLMIGKGVMFRVDKDGIVYDGRDRAFQNTIVLGSKGEVKAIRNSFGNFMNFMFHVFLPIFAESNKGHAIWTNLRPSLQSVINKVPNIAQMSKDEVLNQNGAAQYAMGGSYIPVPDVNWESVGPNGYMDLSSKLNKSIGAKQLINVFNAKTKDQDGWMGAVKSAQLEGCKYYNLDFHFTKKAFAISFLGHTNMDVVRKLCPTLFTECQTYLGMSVEELLHKVAIHTTKVAKGLKRPFLPLAESAQLEKPVVAGWRHYNQKVTMEGFLVRAIFAPTMVSAPGMAHLLRRLALPKALISKEVRNYAKEDVVLKEGSPIDFSQSNVPGLAEAIWKCYKDGQWNYMALETPVELKGTKDEIICHVNKSTAVAFDCSAEVVHEQSTQADLMYIRWMIDETIQSKNDQLVIEYGIQWTERVMKGRSIAKYNVVETKDSMLFNAMNPVLADLKDEVDIIYFQDAVKCDVLYSWLMVIGNTIFHNYGSEMEEYKDLYNELERVMLEIGAPWNPTAPCLTIEPVALLAGKYEKLMTMFETTFTFDNGWTYMEQSATMSQMVYTIYSNRVKMKGGWKLCDELELYSEELQATASLPPGGEYVMFEEEGCDERTNRNVFVFILDSKGNAVEMLQRGKFIVGFPSLPVYNVDLFETSTIRENLGQSQMLFAAIKAMSLVIKDPRKLKEVQKNLVKGGFDAVMRLKLLANMQQGCDWNMSLVFSIHEDEESLVWSKHKDFGNTAGIRTVLLNRLAEEGITKEMLLANEPGTFAKVCNAFSDMTFKFLSSKSSSEGAETKATSFWMPGLIAFTELESKSDDNQDFVARFYHNILLPMICGGDVKRIELAQMLGVFNAFIASENAIKLGNGRKNTGVKRIGMPNIPVGEVWVKYSEHTNSLYQQMKRNGVPMDKAWAGEDVYVANNRAPLAAGPITLVKIVEEWVFNPDTEKYNLAVEDYYGDQDYFQCVSSRPDVGLIHMLTSTQAGCDVVSIALDQGDFDGDTHYVTYLRELHNRKFITTAEMVYAIQRSALGIDMLSAECDVLVADHYGRKSWKKMMATFGSNLAATLRTKGDKSVFLSIEKHVYNNQQAYRIQNQTVGTMYNAYMLGDILTEITVALNKLRLEIHPKMQVLLNKDAKSLVMITSTIYEFLLGGYDPAAIPLADEFLDIVRNGGSIYKDEKGQDRDISKVKASLVGVMNDLKTDANRVDEILAIMELIAGIFFYSKKAPAIKSSVFDTKDFHNWGTLALVVFEFTRGQFEGFGGIIRDAKEDNAKGYRKWLAHRNALRRSLDTIEHLKARYAPLIEECVTLQVFEMIADNLKQEILGSPAGMASYDNWSDDQINYFMDKLPKEVEVEG